MDTTAAAVAAGAFVVDCDEFGSDSESGSHDDDSVADEQTLVNENADEIETPAPFVCASVEELAATGRLDPHGVEVFERGDAIGKSVRALRAFERNDIVCSYGGRVYHADDERYRTTRSNYKYTWSKSILIDGHPKYAESRGHAGSYLNDALGPVRLPGCKNNVRFCNGSFVDPVSGETRPVVWIRAVRRINAGDELWLSYSRQYWRAQAIIEKREAAEKNKMPIDC